MNTALAPVLTALTDAIAESPALAGDLYRRWQRRTVGPDEDVLAPDIADAAEMADAMLPRFTQQLELADAKALFAGAGAEPIFIWCAANPDRSDARMAPLLEAAVTRREYSEQAELIARNRVVQGPLEDALGCVPLLGDGKALRRRPNREARARMEILLWEAGARALQLPELGRWIWSAEATFDVMVAGPARGTLRGRVLAARCLEVAACGIPPTTNPALVGRTLQVLQPLLLHPEPMVWIHAARAFGRLAGTFEPLQGTLLDWVNGATPVLRQRAMTAFASLPKERLAFLGGQLQATLDAPTEEPWALAAAAAATPHLFHERREIWDRLSARILAGDGGAVAARALGRGLATLWRRGEQGPAVRVPFHQLRLMARYNRADVVHDLRRWLELTAVTDPIDGAERDPLDIEIGIENLVRLAARYDDEEADARAARFAGALAPTFVEVQRVVMGEASLRHRAAAINAFEACARSLALSLWGPLLATRPAGKPVDAPELVEAWELLAAAPEELLDLVRSHRESGDELNAELDLALEVLAIKLGGYALDACGEQLGVVAERGPTAHAICRWLRKLDGLVDGTRDLPMPLRSALSALFWRLVDTTRGTSLGEVDDAEWLGPFAAWWGLVVDRPAVLQQLAMALPMIADGALENCCRLADRIRSALSARTPGGAWGEEAAAALEELRASKTELAEALAQLSEALANFEEARGPREGLDLLCLELVMAAERVKRSLADPVLALHSAEDAGDDSTQVRRQVLNAPRMATMVAKAIRARDLALLEVWFVSLGPITSALVEEAVDGAIKRTPPPPPSRKKQELKTVLGYELVKPLGEGGIGTVWLVRKPGADRLFVLKAPKLDVLESASEIEQEGILASFTEEAKALAGLYHPNVANIIDRGVYEDMPFLVLEYLIGADLKVYSSARRMTLFELHRVIPETCAGLTALHNAGLVHRDIKPANIWLRLPLAGGERFVPEEHRDPGVVPPLSTVLIDFGMVRAMQVSPDVGGKFVAGTPGYIAPEQVLDPVELDGRADVYALASTVLNVTTGRTFFDQIRGSRERIIAHMQQDPLEDSALMAGYPSGLVKLMRASTAMDWRDRPTPLEFGREFEAVL